MLKPILLCSSVMTLAVGLILLTATVTPSHPYRAYQTNGAGLYGNRGMSNNVPSNRGYGYNGRSQGYTPHNNGDRERRNNVPLNGDYGYNGQAQGYTPYNYGNRGVRNNVVPFNGDYRYGYNGQVQDYTPRNNVSPYFNPSTGSYYGKGAARYDGQAQQAPNYYYPNNQVQGGVYVSPSRTVITINGGAVNCYNCRNRPNTRFYR